MKNSWNEDIKFMTQGKCMYSHDYPVGDINKAFYEWIFHNEKGVEAEIRIRCENVERAHAFARNNGIEVLKSHQIEKILMRSDRPNNSVHHN